MWLLQIPNAVELGDRVHFVTGLPGADAVAEQLGGKARCVMPPEYETLTLRRAFWQDQGLHLEDLTRDEAQEVALCLELERKHPGRFQKKAG